VLLPLLVLLYNDSFRLLLALRLPLLQAALWLLLACVLLHPHREVLQAWVPTVLAVALCTAWLWLLLLLACVLLHPHLEVLQGWGLAAA
jgi:hypothetical protein